MSCDSLLVVFPEKLEGLGKPRSRFAAGRDGLSPSWLYLPRFSPGRVVHAVIPMRNAMNEPMMKAAVANIHSTSNPVSTNTTPHAMATSPIPSEISINNLRSLIMLLR